jgi:hypothetical protein
MQEGLEVYALPQWAGLGLAAPTENLRNGRSVAFTRVSSPVPHGHRNGHRNLRNSMRRYGPRRPEDASDL